MGHFPDSESEDGNPLERNENEFGLQNIPNSGRARSADLDLADSDDDGYYDEEPDSNKQKAAGQEEQKLEEEPPWKKK